MGKKAIQVGEQIEKLLSRGMVMDWGKDKAQEVLLNSYKSSIFVDLNSAHPIIMHWRCTLKY